MNTILNAIPSGSLCKTRYSWLFNVIIIGISLFITAPKAPQAKIVTSSQKVAVKTVIFDLGGVLFKTSTRTKLSFLPLILKNPNLLKFDAEKEFYTILDTIPAISADPVYNKGKKMPLILADWMAGLKSPQEVKKLSDKAIENSNYSPTQKKFFYKMSDLMFIPQQLAHSQKLIQSMVIMLKKLKEAGYQICILSNWDEESFTYVYKKHPKLFNLCNKICISGKEKLAKPNPKLFKKLLSTHNLHPSECIFIDDEPHNISAAKNLGLKTITHTNKSKTYKELINYGLSL